MGGSDWVDWPLVGRESELQELADLVIHRKRSLALAGQAGVGKTRLLTELSERSRRAGLSTVTITGTSAAAGIPFGVLAPLLPPMDRNLIGRVDARADLLRRTAVEMLDKAHPRRLSLFIDDAHLLDDASATLAYQMATTTPASVIIALRTGEASPSPITALWKDGIAVRHDVSGLSSHDVGELLATVLDAPMDPGSMVELLDRSGGNVLFLRELVIGARASGTLQNDGGIWRICGPLAVSDRLTEIIDSRLRTLTAEERSILELVAVGEPLGFTELRALGDSAVAENLERQKILVSQAEGQRLSIRFAHPLYGDVVRNHTPALRRRVLARSLADAIEKAGSVRPEDLLRVAVWRLDGGGAEAGHMLDAAIEARWRYDFPLAERLVQVARTAGAGLPAELLMAQLECLQGRGETAEQHFAALAADADTDDLMGAIALSRIDNLAFYLGRASDGIAIAEEVEAKLADPAWRDQLQARRSALVFSERGPRAGAEVATPLLERAEGEALVWAAQVAAFTLGRGGRIAEGIEATIRGDCAHRKVRQPLDWYPWTHTFFRCQLLAWSGKFDDALALSAAQYQTGLSEHSAEAQAWFAWQYASTVGECGNISGALQRGREAVALFRELGRPQFMAFSLTYVVMALALGGWADDAKDALRALEELGMSDLFMGVDPRLAQAWTTIADGDLPRGRQYLREAASTGNDIGDLVGCAAALHGIARIGYASEVQEEITALADRMEGELVGIRVDHVRALVSGDPEQLRCVAEAFANIGANLLAAEAATDAAVALRKTNDQRLITASERYAQSLAARCVGAVTPSLTRIAAPVTLSRAEREAVLLAAAGRSNRDIAEELHLSVRTVEGRLQRAYARLGVANRRQLTDALEGTVTYQG